MPLPVALSEKMCYNDICIIIFIKVTFFYINSLFAKGEKLP